MYGERWSKHGANVEMMHSLELYDVCWGMGLLGRWWGDRGRYFSERKEAILLEDLR